MACSLTALTNSSNEPLVVLQHRVLQRGDGVRVPKVPLAVEAVLVLAAVVQVQEAGLAAAEARAVPGQGLAGDDVQADAFDPRRGAEEILADELAVQADGLELLGRLVAPQRRDAHLGHRLQNALFHRGDVVVDEVLDRLVFRQSRRRLAACRCLQRPCRD